MTVIRQQARAKDLHGRLNLESMGETYRQDMNFGRWLEEQNPSAEYKDGMDALADRWDADQKSLYARPPVRG